MTIRNRVDRLSPDKLRRVADRKMGSSAAFLSMVIGGLFGYYYKDSKILSFIISAVTVG